LIKCKGLERLIWTGVTGFIAVAKETITGFLKQPVSDRLAKSKVFSFELAGTNDTTDRK